MSGMEAVPQVLVDVPTGIVLLASRGLRVKAVVGFHREGFIASSGSYSDAKR